MYSMTKYGTRVRSPAATNRGTCGPVSACKISCSTSKPTMFSAPSPAVSYTHLPVAVYFFASGALWQAVALTAWGVLVIGLVDNVLRPILVGKDTRMPDYVVMITTLGGMAVFGINGFVIGPVIGAMFIAAWHIDAVVRRTAQSPPPPAPY